jgi:hypothetical protein
MTTEKRLTSTELARELRAALDTDTGWVPGLCAPNGPAGLPFDAGLEDVAGRLQEFASASTMPVSVKPLLQRAAEAAAAALVTEGTTQYGHLGAAYAYLTQAQGLVLEGTT